MKPEDIPLLTNAEASTLLIRHTLEWLQPIGSVHVRRHFTPGWDGGEELVTLMEDTQEYLHAMKCVGAVGFEPAVDFDTGTFHVAIQPFLSVRKRY